jgi:hypothetical protein
VVVVLTPFVGDCSSLSCWRDECAVVQLWSLHGKLRLCSRAANIRTTNKERLLTVTSNTHTRSWDRPVWRIGTKPCECVRAMYFSVLIIVLASVLLVYWLRYTCLLLDPRRSERALVVPAALDAALHREYLVVQRALRYHRVDSLALVLLRIDYSVARWCHRRFGRCAPRLARICAAEMERVRSLMKDMVGWRLRIIMLPVAVQPRTLVARNRLYLR